MRGQGLGRVGAPPWRVGAAEVTPIRVALILIAGHQGWEHGERLIGVGLALAHQPCLGTQKTGTDLEVLLCSLLSHPHVSSVHPDLTKGEWPVNNSI